MNKPKEEKPSTSEQSPKHNNPVLNLNSTNSNKLGPANKSRLASFRPPRDLSLSSSSSTPNIKPRKTFVPNIPVRRDKTERNLDIKTEKTQKRRERQKHEGGRGRGREREFVQTQGTLFGEGIAAVPQKRGLAGYFGGGGGKATTKSDGFIQKPVFNTNTAFNIDNDLEKKTLKELLRDDFIDDPDEMVPDILPVKLPMIKQEKCYKDEINDSEQFSTNDIKSSSPESLLDAKVKTEPPDESEMCNDIKNIKMTSTDAKDHMISSEMSVKDILTRTNDLLFIKLPNSLPSHPPEIKEESIASTSTGRGTVSQTNSSQNKESLCTLDTLPEGEIGKLRIYKSGRTELILGDHKLLVNKGTQQGFLQDAVSIEADPETLQGSLSVLGHIKHRFVCTPDFENIVRQKNL